MDDHTHTIENNKIETSVYNDHSHIIQDNKVMPINGHRHEIKGDVTGPPITIQFYPSAELHGARVFATGEESARLLEGIKIKNESSFPNIGKVSKKTQGIRLAVMSDSPKIHTGFGVVNKELCEGFVDAGFDVHVLGFMDKEIDAKKVLPYKFYPTSAFDELGHKNFGVFLRKIKPDIIFIISDPGNVWQYVSCITGEKKVADWCRDKETKRQYTPPVVSYTPIEGAPSPLSHGEALTMVEAAGGTCVLYCDTAKEVFLRQFPDLSPEIVWHGLDHAEFQRYPKKDRKLLRRVVGLDDYFVCGAFGVNKRTKNFPALIYAAEILRDRGEDKGIKFYCHTNPDTSTMNGHRLEEMAMWYGVDDMFLWKQERHFSQSYWQGVPRNSDTLKEIREIGNNPPDTPKGRGFLWAHYDFIGKLNCLDVYVDVTNTEGWGLCVMEAMACGVPAISIKDHHVREELHQGGSYMIDTLPPRVWETWQQGMRLATVDPAKIADAILAMKASSELRERYSQKGMVVASRYMWDDSRKKMSRIIKDTYKRYIAEWGGG